MKNNIQAMIMQTQKFVWNTKLKFKNSDKYLIYINNIEGSMSLGISQSAINMMYVQKSSPHDNPKICFSMTQMVDRISGNFLDLLNKKLANKLNNS
jgi:hypothetical protein